MANENVAPVENEEVPSEAEMQESLDTQEDSTQEDSTKKILPKKILPKKILPKKILPKKILPKKILPQEDEVKENNKKGKKLKELGLWNKVDEDGNDVGCVEAMGIPKETFDDETLELIGEMKTGQFKEWLLRTDRPSFELFHRKKAGQVTKLRTELKDKETALEEALAEIEKLKSKFE